MPRETTERGASAPSDYAERRASRLEQRPDRLGEPCQAFDVGRVVEGTNKEPMTRRAKRWNRHRERGAIRYHYRTREVVGIGVGGYDNQGLPISGQGTLKSKASIELYRPQKRAGPVLPGTAAH
ncbi:MAG: hypothetical protein ACYCO3_00025 [Mycobacteriales bacterium]